MLENLFQRWSAAWLRLVDRLPLSDHGIETELPRETFVASPPPPLPVISPVPPASGQPGYQ